MTMTEPSCQSTGCTTESKSSNNGESNLNQSKTCDVHGQEVEDVNSDGGGTDNGPNELINGDLPDFNTDSDPKIIRKEETRGVYFYDRLVTGYLDPPDPWKYVVGWNSEQIAYRYKKSCEKHGTKPLAKLLPQIQNLVNNGNRAECLNLKGEKLDHKQCECIEEILKCVQFQIIDLEGSHLDDECAVALFDMIEYYDSACQLNISFNKNIGVRGWQACARLIRKTPHLRYLDMRNCDLNERSVPIVGRALKLGSTLTVLHLENTYLSGRSLMIMVAALKMNEILEELFLADNKLMASDGIQLGTLLKFNHHLQLLDVRNNHLQDVGTSHLSDGLFEQNLSMGLKTLVLWNNGITYQAMAPLGRALTSTETLVTLNLGHNNITNEGIHRVKDGLLKNKSLLRLGLQGVKITCEGAVALAEYIADSPRLLRLDLRENEIKTAGLMALSLAMRVNETVTRIDLDRDTKKESAMKDYAVQQRRLHHEIITYMDRNQRLALHLEEENKALKETEQRISNLSVEHTELMENDPSPEDTKSYIPSSEKIQRPKLLFSHDTTPQQMLESPQDFHQLSHENIPVHDSSSSHRSLTLQLASISTSESFITTPPAELLLSPQYVPQLTAKKIFSVSKVSESSLSTAGVVVSSPVESSGISATALCQTLAKETLNELVDQIVTVDGAHFRPVKSDNVRSTETKQVSEDGTKCDRSNLLTDTDNADSKNHLKEISVGEKENHPVKVNTFSSEDVVNPDYCDEVTSSNTMLSDNVANTTELSATNLDRGIKDDSKSQLSKTRNVVTVSDISTTKCVTSESDADYQLNVELSTKGECGSLQDKKNKFTINKDSEHNLEEASTEETKKSTEDQQIVEAGMEKSRDLVGSQSAKDLNVEESNTGSSLLTNYSMQGTDSAKNYSLINSEIGSYENEQWLKVDSSNLGEQLSHSQDSADSQQKEKPNFHTNLSVNGLACELASVLDALDEKGDINYSDGSSSEVSKQTKETAEDKS